MGVSIAVAGGHDHRAGDKRSAALQRSAQGLEFLTAEAKFQVLRVLKLTGTGQLFSVSRAVDAVLDGDRLLAAGNGESTRNRQHRASASGESPS